MRRDSDKGRREFTHVLLLFSASSTTAQDQATFSSCLDHRNHLLSGLPVSTVAGDSPFCTQSLKWSFHSWATRQPAPLQTLHSLPIVLRMKSKILAVACKTQLHPPVRLWALRSSPSPAFPLQAVSHPVLRTCELFLTPEHPYMLVPLLSLHHFSFSALLIVHCPHHSPFSVAQHPLFLLQWLSHNWEVFLFIWLGSGFPSTSPTKLQAHNHIYMA